MTSPSELLKLAREATPGPWYHVNAGMVLPKTRTVHGVVPAERVDYVSTWAGVGTPPGHRVVVGSRESGPAMRSCDMAYIAAASPPTIIALVEENERLRGALKHYSCDCRPGYCETESNEDWTNICGMRARQALETTHD